MRDTTYDVNSLPDLKRFASLTRSFEAQHEGYRARRDDAIRLAYSRGMTYEAIGEAVGLTKERIRQICKPDPQEHRPYGCIYCESGEAHKHNPEYRDDATTLKPRQTGDE